MRPFSRNPSHFSQLKTILINRFIGECSGPARESLGGIKIEAESSRTPERIRNLWVVGARYRSPVGWVGGVVGVRMGWRISKYSPEVSVTKL